MHEGEIDLVDFLAGAEAIRESDREFTAEMFLEIDQAAEDGGLALGIEVFEFGEPELEARLSEALADLEEFGRGDPSLLLGVDGIEEHPRGHRFAVGDTEVGEELEFMGGPVTEIEGTRASVFKGIASGTDVFEMDFRAAADEEGHGLGVASGVLGGGCAELEEERAIANDRDFEGFGDAAEPIAIGEGEEELEVVEDGEGWSERAEGIFSAEEIDPIFDADARIILAEHRGGDADLAESAVDESGGETDGIHDRPAPDDDDEGLSIEMRGEHLGDELLDEGEIIFDGLAAGDDFWGGDELELVGVIGEIGDRFGRESGDTFGDALIDKDHRAVATIFLETIESIGEERVRREEEIFGEDYGEFPADINFLKNGIIGHLRVALVIQFLVAWARSRKEVGVG